MTEPKAPYAALTIAVGDVDGDGRTDVTLSLRIGPAVLTPVVVNAPASLAMSLVTSLLDGARTGMHGLAAGALAAIAPSLVPALPGALRVGIGAATALGDDDDADLDLGRR